MRVILIVLDGVGSGSLPDAKFYNRNTNANTLLHVVDNRLHELPFLSRFGFSYLTGNNQDLSSGVAVGRIRPITKDNDSAPIHWEMMGIIREGRLPLYPQGIPSNILEEIKRLSGYDFIGNVMVEKGSILTELRNEHMKTEKPIIYTTTDSVIQIAATIKHVPLSELYRICRIVRNLVPEVGRVIAKPFKINELGEYERDNKNRKDYILELPTNDFLLPKLQDAGIPILAIGKIADFFQNKAISKSISTGSNREGIKAIVQNLRNMKKGLIFANLVDFDMKGHSNDKEGMFSLLKEFDNEMPSILEEMLDDDLLIITSDHGCDPTQDTKTHTREYGILIYHKIAMNKFIELGSDWNFTDISTTISDYFHLNFKPGKIFNKF
jgi:phosphopentomutase